MKHAIGDGVGRNREGREGVGGKGFEREREVVLFSTGWKGARTAVSAGEWCLRISFKLLGGGSSGPLFLLRLLSSTSSLLLLGRLLLATVAAAGLLLGHSVRLVEINDDYLNVGGR